MESELRLHLLGGLYVEYNGHPVAGFDSPRLRAFLAYLVLHQEAPQSRHFLAFLFWPDSSEEQALANLRNLLFRLRHSLPAADDYVYADQQHLQWQPGASFWFDVQAFNQLFAAAKQNDRAGDPHQRRISLQKAADLYQGDLLPDCYDDWLIRERDSLHQTYITCLSQLTALLEDQQETRVAIDYAQQLLQADTLNERAYRQLMRIYGQAGNRASALRVYQTCVTMLETEFGVPPDAQTRSEYERLLTVKPETEEQTPVRIELSTATPFVGRDREWHTLQNAYQGILNHKPQFVMISGVAGIGKTRLAEEFVRTAKRQGIPTAIARCYAAQGDLPYAPLTAWLRALPCVEIEPVWQEELSRLLPEGVVAQAARVPPTGFGESWQRNQLFEAAARAVLCTRPALFLFLDDIQWCDHDTLEWLHFLMKFESDTALMVIATCRTEQQMDNDALKVLLDALVRDDQCVDIPLGPLTERDTYTLAEKLADNRFDQNLAREVYLGSEGNPLFIVEMMRMHLNNQSFLTDWRNEYVTHDVHTLPPKVRTVLESRLAMLSEPAREIAGIAAVIGREFTFSLLSLISDCDEDCLVQSLDELWNRRIIREQGADAYIFSHDRIREVAYEALSTARRRLLHLHVARALATECDSGKSVAYAQTAMHFEQAGDGRAAIPFYKQAGDAAQRTYAYAQAVNSYDKALALLRTCPESRDRRQLEVELLLALGGALVLSRGHSSSKVDEAYSQAWSLCKSLCDSPYRYQALLGLRRYHFVRGEMGKACDLGTQLITEAETLAVPALLARAHLMHCETLYRMGKFRQSLEHSSAGYDLYIPLKRSPYLYDYGTDTGACCLAHGAIVLQFLGYFDRAQSQVDTAIELAQQIEHPFTMSMVHIFAALMWHARRDIHATQQSIESALKIAIPHHFPMPVAWASGLKAWVQCQRGNVIGGIRQLQRAVEDNQEIGFNVQSVEQTMTFCEAYIQSSDFFRASHALDEAFALVQSTGDCCWEAELHRLRGEIHVYRKDFDAAERSFVQSILVAQSQETRLLELRASVSLARLWRDQNHQGEARTLLQSIYDWFSEGFDTPDMQDAAELLRAL